MVSHFIYFIATTTTKIRQMRPPWPNTHHLLFSPPLHSQIKTEYVNGSIFDGDHEYVTHIGKEVSYISFSTVANIQNSRPWRHLSPPLTHLQLYFFFLLTHEINRPLPCPDHINRFQEKEVSYHHFMPASNFSFLH